MCDFLLVINTNLPPILHRFRDIAFDRSKIAIFGYSVAFNPPPRWRDTVHHITLSDISPKTRSRKFRYIFNHFYAVRPESYRSRWNNAKWRQLRSRSFKVTDFGTNRKLIYDFLLVINSNLPPILHRFGDIHVAFDNGPNSIFGYPSCVELPRRRDSPGKISVKFSTNISGWPRYKMAKKHSWKFQPAE